MRYVYRGLVVALSASLTLQSAQSDDTPSCASEQFGLPSYSAYLQFAAPDSPIRTAIDAQLVPWRSKVSALCAELSTRVSGSTQAAAERVTLFMKRYNDSQIAAERRMLQLSELEGILRTQAQLNFLVENTIGKGIKAEKRQIDESAARLAVTQPSQELLSLEQLLFPIAPDEDPAKLALLRTAADKAHQELATSSASFSDVATEFAANPYFVRYQRLPGLAANELTPELARALSAAPQGSLSPPLRSSYGIHIVRVVKRFAAEPAASEVDIAEEALGLRLRESIARALKDLESK